MAENFDKHSPACRLRDRLKILTVGFLRAAIDMVAGLVARVSCTRALQISGNAERMIARLTSDSSPAEIISIFGEEFRDRADQIADAVAANQGRQRLLRLLRRRLNIASFIPLLEVRGFDALHERSKAKQPAILVFAHLGPAQAIASAFIRENLPALALRKSVFRDEVPPPIKTFILEDQPSRATAGLKAVLDELKRGGMVLVAFDGTQGTSGVEYPFLKGRMVLPRGIAAQYRLTRAPIIPITATWQEGKTPILVQVHAPLELPENGNRQEIEAAVMVRVVLFFEQFLKEHPCQIRINQIRKDWRPQANGGPFGYAGKTPP